jgi:hypothetical protein
VTTDSELDSVGDLASMARMMKGIESRDIQMSTLPVAYDPADPNRVLPMRTEARRMWSAIRRDVAVPKSATKGSAGEGTDIGGVVRQE